MGASAIIAAIADTGAADVAASTLADAAAGAVADTAATDAATGALAAGADAGTAAAAGDAAAGAADATAAAGGSSDAAAAAGADAGSTAAGSIAPTDITAASPTPVESATTTAGSATDAAGNTVQTFDDGSKLTLDSQGNVVHTTDVNGVTTDPQGNVLASAGSADQAPVYDAASATPGVGANTPDPSLGSALGGFAGAAADALGPAGLAALGLGGAALASGALSPSSNQAPVVSSDGTTFNWGTPQPLVSPGINPGFVLAPASVPTYNTTNPTQSQYYWGVHPAVTNLAQLNTYNQNIPGAPAQPWGATNSAVGGQAQMNVSNFINNILGMGNPYAAPTPVTGPISTGVK